jgi:hypothetical protein
MLSKAKTYEFAAAAGDHENCWLDPAPYIDIIKQHL